jgi:outer membrane biosynthesis protein TonB
VNRATRLSLSLGASGIGHLALGWQLYVAPLAVDPLPRADTFEVRMLTLPPPPRPAEAPPRPAEPERVDPPKAPPPKPPEPRKPKLEPPRPAASEPPREVSEPAAEPEPSTAPPALLAESGFATGAGIVQRPGGSIGAVAMAGDAPRAEPLVQSPSPGRPSSAPLAKLSDLSRKPMAPSLNAALRQNYPPELRRRGMEGQAEVRVVIDRRGRVGELAVVSETANGFAEACRRTLLGSTWSEPLDREGRPVSTRLTYRCRFQIER